MKKVSFSLSFQLQLIKSNGYPGEEYNVTTSDGYILTMQRIPYGRKGNTSKELTVSMYNVIMLCPTIKGDYTCFTDNNTSFEMFIICWYFNIEFMTDLSHEFNTLNNSFNASIHCMSKVNT